jgi:hypothetical protein
MQEADHDDCLQHQDALKGLVAGHQVHQDMSWLDPTTALLPELSATIQVIAYIKILHHRRLDFCWSEGGGELSLDELEKVLESGVSENGPLTEFLQLQDLSRGVEHSAAPNAEVRTESHCSGPAESTLTVWCFIRPGGPGA